MRLAAFNVENLFARARVMNRRTWPDGRTQLAAFERFTRVSQRAAYDAAAKRALLDDLVTLRVLVRMRSKLVRQPNPRAQLALLRENRGDFLVERRATGAEVVARGRGDWIGWLELVTEEVDETATRMTARVIADVRADVLAVVEAEDRPSLVQFDESLLSGRYRHVMLVDGNDPRGIDVALLTGAGLPIASVESHVDDRDTEHPRRVNRDDRLFSRDAPAYRVETGGEPLYVVVNHLKSQSYRGGESPDRRRARQARRLAAIYRDLRARGARHVALVGHFNRGVARDGSHPSLEALFDPALGLIDCFSLTAFDPGPKPGTFQACSIGERLDYLFLSPELAERATGGGVFRRGLWGRPSNVKPPTAWDVYPEITAARHAASDHAAIYVDLDFPVSGDAADLLALGYESRPILDAGPLGRSA